MFVDAVHFDDDLSGAMATIVTHPFDTVKSIRQVQLGTQTSASSGQTLALLRQMFRQQGPRGWYKGTTDSMPFDPRYA